jgi:hypothetical protein
MAALLTNVEIVCLAGRDDIWQEARERAITNAIRP